MKCKDCKYYECLCDGESMEYRKQKGNVCENKICNNMCEDDVTGFCYRFPPSEDSGEGIKISIIVSGDAWCGEYLPK